MPGLLAHDGRNLVTQRLAAAGRHQDQRVAALNDVFHDGLLRPAKVAVAEDLLQDSVCRRQKNALYLIATSTHL